jgi:pimeloyl-ACP methyl ester carboxylesterase
MGDEGVRLSERGDRALADEIDDGLAEAEGPHGLEAIFRAVPPVTQETIELDDQPVFLRRAGDDAVPILYLHGLPTSSYDWIGPLALGGGIAVDLPGFGRSGKRGDLDYTLAGHVAFVDRLLDELGIARVRLCLHDWGAAVGLAWAIEQPERVERLVVVNGVPLLHGFRWRGWARAVRAPVLGPVAVGSATKPVVRWLSRRASAGRGPMAESFVASVAEQFDLGTERALLRILRSASPELLAAAGAGLSRVGVPALVLWGALDPYLPARFGAGYAATLGDATLETVQDAGHWPWLDRPECGELIIRHLADDRSR